MTKFKWGIIGSGEISSKFIESNQVLVDSEVVAVSSKSLKRAQELADKYKIKGVYDSYKNMLETNIDGVYIATTNNYHFENIKLCLEYNKHVLCEKPITISFSQLNELVNLAKSKKLLLMEAMWTRFLPPIRELRQAVKEGMVGEVKYIKTNFTKDFYALGDNLNPRIINPELGGGGLLDLGIYSLSFIDMFFEREFKDVKSTLSFTYTQVDDTVDAIIDYGYNNIGYIHTSISQFTSREAIIVGSEGYIRIPQFNCPTLFQVILAKNEDSEVIPLGYEEPGFQYEIESFIRSVEKKELSNEEMSLDASLRISKIMDKIRHSHDFYYPDEKNT